MAQKKGHSQIVKVLEEAENDRKKAIVSNIEKKPSDASSSSTVTPTAALQDSLYEAVKLCDLNEVDRLIKMGGSEELVHAKDKVRVIAYG